MTMSVGKALPRLRGTTSPFRLLRPVGHSTAPVLQARSSSTATSLTGRTCLITGGTSGIGHAIAARFLREGVDRAILVGRSYERLVDAGRRLDGTVRMNGAVDSENEVATRAPEEDSQNGTGTEDGNGGGGEADVSEKQDGTLIQSSRRISLLIGDVGEAGGWMRELEREMESVDILVNAAGLSGSSILPKTDLPDISRILRTNLEGAVLTSRALVRASIRARARRNRRAPTQDPGSQARGIPSKCIINISSLLASKGGAGTVSYAASKAGLLGLTRSLAVESAHSLRDVVVRSNAIVPGYIDTPMISDFSEGETAKLKETIPLRRFGEADEVADAAVFLARNEYANNCVLNLDGGLSAV